MNRLFRTATPGTPGYLALAIFVVGYLGMMTLIIAPQSLIGPQSAIAADH